MTATNFGQDLIVEDKENLLIKIIIEIYLKKGEMADHVFARGRLRLT